MFSIVVEPSICALPGLYVLPCARVKKGKKCVSWFANKKKNTFNKKFLVPMTGLEPAWTYPLVPKTSVSANFTTSAYIY